MFEILFYATITVLFLLGLLAMIILKKGGDVMVIPINGFGLIFQSSKLWVDMGEDEGFFNHNITIGFLFLFIVFNWQTGATNGPMDFFDNNDKNDLAHGL